MVSSSAIFRVFIAVASGMASACIAGNAAIAQTYPERPVKLMVGFAPGGALDVAARILAQKMSEGFGRSVIVENRSGAGGGIANSYVAKATPDGYTLLTIGAIFAVQAATQKLPFDPVKDFAWISMVSRYPFVMLVRADDGRFASLGEFIAYARGNAGKINFPVVIGSVHHLSGELLNAMAGIGMTPVPVRGGSLPMAEVLSGRQDMLFNDILTSKPHILAGKVRPIGVTSLQPSGLLPDVPPIAQFLPGFEVQTFIGVVAPGGTPPAIVGQLNREVRRVLALSDVRQKLAELGGETNPTTPDDMRKFVTDDIAKWQRVVRDRKLQMQ